MLAVDLVSSAVSAPTSEVISQTVEAIFETVAAANDVLVKKDTFKELATYVVRVVPILRELNKKTVVHSESLNNVMEILNREIRAAKQLTLECSKRNKVFLLMNCRHIVKRLEDIMREISRALSLLPLSSLDLSSGIIEEIEKLCDNMQRAEFRAAIAEEEILDKIESGIQERNMDRSYANNLLVLIAEAVGISTERSVLKKELEEFRSEIENARLRKDQAEAIQMEQIIALLERADAASSPREKEMKYIIKRKSLGGQPLEPLQSFICPITREVMVDPVETSSGQTFERSAIEKWFADGNRSCPLTMTSLDTSILRPNKTLRQSIEEWKDRNTMIMIASLKSKLQSEEDEEVLHCLGELLDLCKERDLHKEWVILENYIPILIQLLGVKNPEIRNHALVNLCILVKDSDDAKERINKADNGIESIVRSLGRRVEERKLAVALLLELSKSNLIREQIGKVQGSILLLVTMSNSDDNRAARDARELLENLSFSDQNVIQMAKANYFTHLLQRLSAGPEDVKMAMASNLAEMELTDHNKESLIEGGVLSPLLYLVSHGDIPIKTVAVKALRNLSSLPKNGLQMIREGAERPLLDLLFNLSSSLSSLREYLAATIMHLAMSVSLESSQTPVSFLESDEDILKLFSLINLMGPNVQKSIIRTFHTLCQSPSAISIKTKLIQSSAIQVLVQLCENDDLNLRANAVKLFSCLVEGGSESTTILEHVNQKCIETILKIIKASDDEEEIASAMGIISNLPEIPVITQWLVDAGTLPAVFSFLQNGKQNGPHKNQLIENAVGAICRFTVSTNLEWQKSAAEAGIIPLFVQLLESGTSLTKKRAAISLSRFSESSPQLSRSLPNRKGFCCFSAPPETGCPVHGGICGIVSSFCLVEADAVGPLVRILGEPDPGACEASLDALLTLIEGERLHTGSKVLTDANAIPPIIKFLVQPYPSLQEKALHALERMFRLLEFKQKFGSLAQMPLVDLTQRGSGSVKSMAARILAHLNVLHDQSSYF
ncbi:PREDICTED: U-box domain-containing protein 44-like [Prunus mume]|uniref:RING-type E3 ubiquitin transferase n=1 Tax=Prunus mume TaxID=102107 RepID=A0ABM1LRS2_PRUMU|nr:PREDICTED: U-box domain-containing protein 44-like [Prunus mume]XP_008233096.1 PREDICTED: U-box domain-containing protein 44-like [Prunus mume]XP_016650098.1 PREDICTED: U-box domain-containing protein 44-like [Prunus mume]XP_016650099.1 PREDICTED: U-box domain-containing protein 44-like [Prunus mume]